VLSVILMKINVFAPRVIIKLTMRIFAVRHMRRRFFEYFLFDLKLKLLVHRVNDMMNVVREVLVLVANVSVQLIRKSKRM